MSKHRENSVSLGVVALASGLCLDEALASMLSPVVVFNSMLSPAGMPAKKKKNIDEIHKVFEALIRQGPWSNLKSGRAKGCFLAVHRVNGWV